MSYFQDEFAGRIGANLMQTALAVRDTAMKVLNVLNYVAFYFAGAVVLAAINDWRLAIPFLLWLAGYGLLLRFFIPRMADISEKQASARALMTGRVVDAYTNISTVKLFSHSNREASYAKEAMQEFLQSYMAEMQQRGLQNMPQQGDHPVSFSVSANTGSTSRTGKITVRDKVVTVTQAAP